MIDFFVYNSRTGQLEFNEYQILLIREFAKIYDLDRNKCKEDKTGIYHLLAKKEFTYMWLKMNKKSPYSQYSELEAHMEALKDSGLTKEEFDDPDFRAACRKYLELRDSNRISKMLRAIYNKVDDITDYFDNIVDLNERDSNGKPIFKLKDLQAEIKNVGDVLAGVKQLELMYDKEEEAKTDLRSDATPGFRD